MFVEFPANVSDNWNGNMPLFHVYHQLPHDWNGNCLLFHICQQYYSMTLMTGMGKATLPRLSPTSAQLEFFPYGLDWNRTGNRPMPV